MDVPVKPVVPHAVPAWDDWVEQPGVYTSGLRRPSEVGPIPAVQ